MDITPEELTDDPFEQEALDPHDYVVMEPDDPHYAEMAQLGNEISHNKAKLRPMRRQVTTYLNSSLSNKEIAEKVGCSPATVTNAKADPIVQRIVKLNERRNYLQAGPSKAQRMNMLWRIAKREEKPRPNTSIRAVDILNKQLGDYAQAEDSVNSGIVIRINNFTVNSAGPSDNNNSVTLEHEPDPTAEIAQFTPVTVKVRN